jgi:hypothetical protein
MVRGTQGTWIKLNRPGHIQEQTHVDRDAPSFAGMHQLDATACKHISLSLAVSHVQHAI